MAALRRHSTKGGDARPGAVRGASGSAAAVPSLGNGGGAHTAPRGCAALAALGESSASRAARGGSAAVAPYPGEGIFKLFSACAARDGSGARAAQDGSGVRAPAAHDVAPPWRRSSAQRGQRHTRDAQRQRGSGAAAQRGQRDLTRGRSARQQRCGSAAAQRGQRHTRTVRRQVAG
ncbi:hypothetical protein JKP88DRAFT_253354 [Tribonema minus]|uniref:Uncharacterized protein n=1 Tax=Tribonema minus TaxID=303371 RepID=A0A835Z7P6_9STRA|nr:hypothetical protein JKP88DRAFT_253354 [Tribonema minus]